MAVLLLSGAGCRTPQGAGPERSGSAESPTAAQVLDASSAAVRGSSSVRLEAHETAEARDLLGEVHLRSATSLRGWRDTVTWIEWSGIELEPGQYFVDLRYACAPGCEGARIELLLSGRRLETEIRMPTPGWEAFRSQRIGVVTFDEGLEDGEAAIYALSIPGEELPAISALFLRPAD